jgi:hypothetical protein
MWIGRLHLHKTQRHSRRGWLYFRARLGPRGAARGGGRGWERWGRGAAPGGPGEPVQFRFKKPKRVAEASWLALVEGLSQETGAS